MRVAFETSPTTLISNNCHNTSRSGDFYAFYNETVVSLPLLSFKIAFYEACTTIGGLGFRLTMFFSELPTNAILTVFHLWWANSCRLMIISLSFKNIVLWQLKCAAFKAQHLAK